MPLDAEEATEMGREYGSPNVSGSTGLEGIANESGYCLGTRLHIPWRVETPSKVAASERLLF